MLSNIISKNKKNKKLLQWRIKTMNKPTVKINTILMKKDYQKIKQLVSDEKYISASEFIRIAVKNELQKLEKN